MWFCSSGLGPGPSNPGGTVVDTNGLVGPSNSRKKNRAIANSVTIAQPTSSSSMRLRKRHATDARYPDRMMTHSRIDPSSADHIVATLNRGGVAELPCSATYFTEKSRVIRARSMAITAVMAPASTAQA